MNIDRIEEPTRDKVQAGAEQLGRLSLAQFEQFFGSLFEEETFESSTDSLMIDVTFDARYGIDTLQYIHMRAHSARDDRALTVLTGETWLLSDPLPSDAALGITSLTLIHPMSTRLTSDRLMQGMYDAFIAVLTNEQPSTFFTSAYRNMMLYQQASQSLDVTVIHGEQWTRPDLPPPPDKRLEYVPDRELPAVLGQIDVSQPLLGPTCACRMETCERCDPRPSELSGIDLRQFIDRQLHQHRIHDGDAVRAVAVITRNEHTITEEWVFEDLYHWKCALPEETFRGNYTARRSVGKDEVLLEGRVTYGEKQPHPVEDYYDVSLSNIEILARQGTDV